ncbi:MAG TPA: GlsB/YeaQ/YmgE family stress response membrane protein [Terricaulis sp.]|nr:GlsB/YeaQ/YmgE family stress response membrane protein [Terricaulis sp.]
MSLETLIIWLIVGGVAGFLAGLIVKGYGLGIIGNIVVGIVGAVLAGWLLPQLGIGFSVVNPLVTSILYATIGAVILLVLLGLVRRAR